jgi:hypothetical protein
LAPVGDHDGSGRIDRDRAVAASARTTCTGTAMNVRRHPSERMRVIVSSVIGIVIATTINLVANLVR